MIGKALPIAKYIRVKKVNIYDAVFALHTKLTVVILLVCTLLLSAKQYFDEPIHCITDMKFKDFVYSYCWTIGSFLVPSALERPGNTIAVGVGPVPNKTNRFMAEMITLRYYQWVGVVLLLEAVVFYLPACLWKRWEGRRMEQLCTPVGKYDQGVISVCVLFFFLNTLDLLFTAETLIPIKTRMEHCDLLVNYFNSDNRLQHANYVAQYVTCDLLNLIVSVSSLLHFIEIKRKFKVFERLTYC